MKERQFIQLTMVLTSLTTLPVTSPIPAPASYSDRVDFYQEDPHVVNLNNSTFYEALLGKPYAWVVEFYRDWCGHCRRYSHVWSRVARQTADWRTVVHVGALNCAFRRNTAICRRYKIHGVPHVRMFLPWAGRNTFGVPKIEPNAKLQVSAIATFLGIVQSHQEQENWPYLGDFNGSLQQLLLSPQPVQALILDDTSDPIGRLLQLDLSGQQQMVRVSWSFSVPSGLREPTHDRPVMVVFTNGRRQTVTADQGEDPRSLFRTALRRLVGLNAAQRKSLVTTTSRQQMAIGRPATSTRRPSFRTDVVYMVDIENALVTALRTEVAAQTIIGEERLTALKDFLSVLVNNWPGRRRISHFLLQLLHTSNNLISHVLQFVRGKECVTGQEVEQHLQQLQLPTLQKYRGCRGSKPGYRGYSCGLWTLFHALTIQAMANELISPYSVLPSIHGYVKYFFSCRYCTQHFQKMAAEDGLLDVANSRDAVLWLWKAHNKVNARIAGDLTEDPQHPKVQFPGIDLCPYCWRNGQQDTQNTLYFLNNFYGRNHILLEGVQPLKASVDEHQARDTGSINVLDHLISL